MRNFEVNETESTYLVRQSDKEHVQPLSLLWRINHVIPYLIGGTTFVAGSYQYLPSVSKYVLGGWLFTVGSTGFLYADLNEWWMNNRVGCMFDSEYRNDFEDKMGKHFDPPSSFCGKYQRAENGMNFMLSVFGSLLYLIGSVLFIPSLGEIVEGTVIFIIGSAVIFIAQMWKLYRAGCTLPTRNTSNKYQQRVFELKNLADDLPGVGVDLCAGLGGAAYFVGSYLFLRANAVTNAQIELAATWFLSGGVLFTLSGVFLAYRYFCTRNYPH